MSSNSKIESLQKDLNSAAQAYQKLQTGALHLSSLYSTLSLYPLNHSLGLIHLPLSLSLYILLIRSIKASRDPAEARFTIQRDNKCREGIWQIGRWRWSLQVDGSCPRKAGGGRGENQCSEKSRVYKVWNVSEKNKITGGQGGDRLRLDSGMSPSYQVKWNQVQVQVQCWCLEYAEFSRCDILPNDCSSDSIRLECKGSLEKMKLRPFSLNWQNGKGSLSRDSFICKKSSKSSSIAIFQAPETAFGSSISSKLPFDTLIDSCSRFQSFTSPLCWNLSFSFSLCFESFFLSNQIPSGEADQRDKWSVWT